VSDDPIDDKTETPTDVGVTVLGRLAWLAGGALLVAAALGAALIWLLSTH
jgi:hypothetical protein